MESVLNVRMSLIVKNAMMMDAFFVIMANCPLVRDVFDFIINHTLNISIVYYKIIWMGIIFRRPNNIPPPSEHI